MTAPNRVVLAAAFHEAYERLAPEFGYETRRDSAVPWEQVPEPNRSLMLAVADALLAGPLAPPAAAPGPEGEAVERVRAWLARWESFGVPAEKREALSCSFQKAPIYVHDLRALLAAVDRLTAAEQRVEVARRALIGTGYFTEDEVGDDVAPRITELWSARMEPSHRLIAAVDDLTAKRDRLLDLAFRAAFAPEEGAEVQWGVVSVKDSGVAYVFGEHEEATAREIAAGMPDSSALKTRVVGPWRPAPSPGSGEDGGDG